MVVKSRIEPNDLIILEILQRRMKLTEKEEQYYLSLKKGFEGERLFDEWLNNFPKGWYFLNDLLFKENNTYFQIDSLGILGDSLYLFDIKNYDGNYVVMGDTWKTLSGTEIKNPLHQLHRCEGLLKRLLKEHGFNLQVKPYLIFINPTFTLYQAPIIDSIIFPTQLASFIENLKRTSVRSTAKQSKLINFLISSHQENYSNPHLPKYDYDELKKGVFCLQCGGRMTIKKKSKTVICNKCGNKENAVSAIIRTVNELNTLFPEIKITTSKVNDWCGGMFDKKRLQRTLSKHFTKIEKRKYTYYI